MKTKLYPYKKRHGEENIQLQITSMADIFIIILVFLLKSFATGTVQVSPSAGVRMPVAQADVNQIEALKLEISEHTIQVEGSPVVALSAFRFQGKDLDVNKSSKALVTVLQKERVRELYIAKINNQVKVDPKIIIVADERTPYTTIKVVLASAAVTGYTDFKLAVIRKE